MDNNKKDGSGTVNVCERCGKKNPAEIHTCTPYFHFEKYIVSQSKLKKIKNTEGVEKVEYSTDTTKIVAYKLYGKLYISDMIQL